MACRICRRNNCCSSFHTIEAQEEYQRIHEYCENKIEQLENKIDELERDLDEPLGKTMADCFDKLLNLEIEREVNMSKHWKVMPDPLHKGKHPLHDSRWIVTVDAKVEFSPHVPGDWTLSSGSLVCRMTDLPHQDKAARLIAAAPELLTACEDIEDGPDNNCAEILLTDKYQQGLFCGLEDMDITDRYDACMYGFNKAVERVVAWAQGMVEAAIAKATE